MLISIGCNSYDYENSFKSLTGAEFDARRIFNALIKPDTGDYDLSRSKLLLSPSIGEVRSALREVLFSTGTIDTFSFFFAGHGGVQAGSFYMCVRDSTPATFSMSAYSLSDLFRSLNEAAPAQTNIIIDACESGGLVSDLGALLKRETIGDAGTPGVTLVATSAQNQNSSESDNGGFGTNAILDCIEGRVLVQDNESALDLVEIGRHISTHLQASGQNPVVWGLNLYGPPRFCRNPRYGGDPARPLREVIHAWPAGSDATVRANYDCLWRAYASTSADWDSRVFADIVTSVLLPLAATPVALAGFVDRLGAATLERANLSADVFRLPQVAACLAVCLLPHISHDAIARQAKGLMVTAGETLLAAGSQLAEDLRNDRYAILGRRGGGLSDLFLLPMRISKILGWTATAFRMFDPGDIRRDEADCVFTDILRLLLERYTFSIATMSDAQAPFWAIALTRASALNLTEEAEQLAGLLFNSLLSCHGNLARWDIPPDETLRYLEARHAEDFEQAGDLIDRPIETLTVLLRAAAKLNLADVFDENLWEIDGVGLSAYLTSDFTQYGAEMMVGGQNLVWEIGHTVFRVGDLECTWPESPLPQNEVQAAAAILGALLYPDRVPWFCFDE